MDIVLEAFDTFFFDRVYATVLPSSTLYESSPYQSYNASATTSSVAQHPTHIYEYKPASELLSFTPSQWAYRSQWQRDNVYRQTLSLFLITWIFGFIVYFATATLSYYLVFDKTAVNHPKFLKNQIRLEIKQAFWSLPGMALLTTPCFLSEVLGYSKLYDSSKDGPGVWYDVLQFPLFLCFTDFFIYLIHRGLHSSFLYKRLHKPHHKWIMPTPFASHAFHPIDGFAQSIPYHLFPFIFPLQKLAYLGLFVFINIWTVMIHDGEYVADSPIINGAACHTMHHLYFNYNYGQFTTLWDRLCGSYRKPNEELFRRDEKFSKKEWERQAKEMETLVKEVEGEDDRTYDPEPVPVTQTETKKSQ